MREVINPLSVWDAGTSRQILLPPGAILTACQIRRTAGEYAVEFQSEGRHYTCPLFRFQPRTQPLDSPTAAAAAVL